VSITACSARAERIRVIRGKNPKRKMPQRRKNVKKAQQLPDEQQSAACHSERAKRVNNLFVTL